MTSRELVAWCFGGATIIAIVASIGYFMLQMHKVDAEINAKTMATQAEINAQTKETEAEIARATEIKRVEIEEKAATQRTRERMHWLPWYSDETNETEVQPEAKPE